MVAVADKRSVRSPPYNRAGFDATGRPNIPETITIGRRLARVERLPDVELADEAGAIDPSRPVGVEHAEPRIVRRSARAILVDDSARLVLIKRTKPGRVPYWTTAGGGVEDSDVSVEAAMRREVLEELGAEAGRASQVFMLSDQRPDGIRVQHFFVARLVHPDLAAPTGPEFLDPSNGTYDVDYVDLRADALAGIDLRPPELKDFILANRTALLAEAGFQIRHSPAKLRHDAGQAARCSPAFAHRGGRVVAVPGGGDLRRCRRAVPRA